MRWWATAAGRTGEPGGILVLPGWLLAVLFIPGILVYVLTTQIDRYRTGKQEPLQRIFAVGRPLTVAMTRVAVTGAMPVFVVPADSAAIAKAKSCCN